MSTILFMVGVHLILSWWQDRQVRPVSDYLRYDPLDAPAVQVRDDGTWWDGYAEARQQDPDGWRWCVRYSKGVGDTRIGWFDQDEIRVSPSAAPTAT